MSVTAAHMGITASPVSAACAALLTVLAPQGISLLQILGVCIPATLFGVCVGIASVWRKGADLDSDPEFLQKLKDPAFAASLESVAEKASSNGKEKYAARSVWLFAAGVFFVVLLGSIPSLIPSYPVSSNFSGTFTLAPSGRIQIAALIMMVMLAVTGLIVLTTGTSTAAVAKSSLFGSAGQAAIAVFGVVWMSGTFMGHNHDLIQGALKNIVTAAPWLFAVALFALSTLLFSQAATAKALMPLGLTLGLAPSYLIGIFPAVNGHFFIPGYPTLLTAIQFDRTGTTRIGKYVVNHSFMLPGLITTGASVVIGIVLNKIFL
jgi:anaerobic C4-dicarboxylate transporter DcuA